jgi:peptidoglycan hydrolase-like amidase
MEQAGAVLMALIDNWTYTDIINYYYDGELININDWVDTNMDSLINKFYVKE